MIYLDYASTTPVNQEVLKAYTYVLEKYYANTDSLHDAGLRVAELMEQSREQTASCLKVKANELMFTSGASEANNMAIKGSAFALQHRGKHLITSCVEHSSVDQAMKQLQELFGFEVTYLPVNSSGVVEAETLRRALRKDTILVSIMALNNEVGSINDIAELAKVTHESSRAVFHSDCTQILGKQLLTFLPNIELASFSAHKIYGLKGSGLLYHKQNVHLVPLICGGQQEAGLRGGTSNAPSNIAWAKTIRIACEEMDEHSRHVSELNQHLRLGLAEIDGVEINSPHDATPYILNFSVMGMTSEVMLNALNHYGICVSSRSTCSSKTKAPSKVLMAMGYSEERATHSLRISLSHLSKKSEVDELLKVLKEIFNDYRIK